MTPRTITRRDRLELMVDDQMPELRSRLLELTAMQDGLLTEEQAAQFVRAAYGKGWKDATGGRGPSADDLASVGYAPTGERIRARRSGGETA